MNIEQKYSKKIPQPREKGEPYGVHLCKVKLNFNVQELEEPDPKGNRYSYNTIQIYQGKFTYSGVISEIINAKYSNDEMWAIVNNHDLDNTNPKYIQEYTEMQEWRAMAKEYARGLFGDEEADRSNDED